MHKLLSSKLFTGIALGLCLSLPAQADNPDSINRIAASNFGIDQTEIDSIRNRMQEAVDGEFIPMKKALVCWNRWAIRPPLARHRWMNRPFFASTP